MQGIFVKTRGIYRASNRENWWQEYFTGLSLCNALIINDYIVENNKWKIFSEKLVVGARLTERNVTFTTRFLGHKIVDWLYPKSAVRIEPNLSQARMSFDTPQVLFVHQRKDVLLERLIFGQIYLTTDAIFGHVYAATLNVEYVAYLLIGLIERNEHA